MILHKLLKGNNIELGVIDEEDIEAFASWYNDSEFLRFFDKIPAYPKSKEELMEWVRGSRSCNRTYSFAIKTVDGKEMIGYIELSNIQWWNGAANLGIGIGSKSNRGNGYGKEAMNLILDFAFNELNLHRVQLNVFSYNTAAIALYEKMGFKREGTYREFIHRDGKRFDMYLYGILEEEWRNIK